MREPGYDDDRALIQTLTVVAVEGEVMRVEGARMSACAACAAKRVCATAALGELTGGGALALTLPRSPDARPGDTVELALPGAALVGTAGLAYLLPAGALVAAAGVFSGLGLPETAVALLCLPVLALSFLPLRLAERRGRMLAGLRVERVTPGSRHGAGS